ncbi:hypothetical protein LIER_30666 [Lithospermum erythrorhizon]|uniref:Helitron helicase-like domain-containing protein n=1 Tax=Lithospermum erythrorhizon TaxID=34254 RepID=A0AAV3RU95_LITER
MHCDEALQKRDHGIYTVKVQGQIHHYLDDLIPQDGCKRLSGIQFYFYDPEHQETNRLSALPRLNALIVEDLVVLMNSNPYSVFLKEASALEEIDNYHIVIRSDPGLDQRTYNRPTSSEVAGIWTENVNGEIDPSDIRDIRVYTRSGSSHRVQYYYACYDPLQYVLMFPNGEPGWHGNIPRAGCRTKRKNTKKDISAYNSFEEIIEAEKQGASTSNHYELLTDDFSNSGRVSKLKRNTVSCREYYVYKLQQRENDRSYLLRFGRLLQQYVVDNYIKIESMRLAFYTHQKYQKQLRREYYQGIMDSVVSGVQLGSKVGRRLYLPASFIGGPRDLRHRYLDSMALVQEYGKPDIFLTITCNPNWIEIKRCLKPGEEAHNRPDLLCRVFKAKLTILNEKIMSGELFGKVAAVVHVVEFQKRGLPHAHFLIILKPAYKYLSAEAYDRIVCAELPDKIEDPYLYSLVVKHMMHGPCGSLNSNNVCMVNGKCKNHYPKEFAECTTHGKGTYPAYRRRNNGRTAKVRGHILDNRWVIPYNLALLAEFNCHINIELCCDIKAVKYLYKYIHKGHHKVLFKVGSDSEVSTVNEIADFQNARWVSPVEATWRILGFPLYGMCPAVIQIQVHMPNFHCIQFEDDTDLEDLLHNEGLQRTMLTEFFTTNDVDSEAKRLNLLYKQFLMYYVWDSQIRTWTRRKKGKVIGRLCTVNPVEGERYYLRLLLNNVHAPTSYDFLLLVDGVQCETFQMAAYLRGLLQQDGDIDKTMEEASV